MELKVVNDQGQQTATLAAADTVFGREYNEALVHQPTLVSEPVHS